MTEIAIPLSSKKRMPFTPPSLMPAVDGEPAVTIHMRIPNWGDRDAIGHLAYRLGARVISPESIEAQIIDQLYEQNGDAEGERRANLIEEVQLLGQQDAVDIEQWREQEDQRVKDELAGAPPRPPYELPKSRVSPRNRSRSQIYKQEAIDGSPKIQAMLSDSTRYAEFEIAAMARLHIAAVHGLNGQIVLSNEVATKDSIEWLRDELHPLSPTAWNETIDYIRGLYTLSKDQVGNSSSPPENGSPPDGLSKPSDELASSGGNSTASSISPAQDEGSQKTTDPLSDPTLAAEVAILAENDGRTAAAS